MVFAFAVFAAMLAILAYTLVVVRPPPGQALPALKRTRLIVLTLAPALALALINFVGALLFFALFRAAFGRA